MAGPRPFSCLKASGTSGDTFRPVLVHCNLARTWCRGWTSCWLSTARLFQHLQGASASLSRELPDRLELTKPKILIGGEFMNCLRRWTPWHKAVSVHTSPSRTSWCTIACVSHATPTALNAKRCFVEPRSSTVDRIIIEALGDVHVLEIAKPLPSATVGALGEHVSVDQAHVCVQHHLWVQVTAV